MSSQVLKVERISPKGYVRRDMHAYTSGNGALEGDRRNLTMKPKELEILSITIQSEGRKMTSAGVCFFLPRRGQICHWRLQ